MRSGFDATRFQPYILKMYIIYSLLYISFQATQVPPTPLKIYLTT